MSRRKGDSKFFLGQHFSITFTQEIALKIDHARIALGQKLGREVSPREYLYHLVNQDSLSISLEICDGRRKNGH